MPLHKKKNNHTLRNILIGIVVVALIALMIISFSPAQNVTEIVLYP
ncbi:MAG: hypothetical protein K2M34_00150 [Alphaproteobacteria bacterium]|nr:hypothetical protein [Alphaproteobacteria bacterium]